jgi:hypothetical protein
VNQSNERLITMILGWTMAFYGVYRRDWRGTIVAMTGIVMAEGVMILGETEQGLQISGG